MEINFRQFTGGLVSQMILICIISAGKRSVEFQLYSTVLVLHVGSVFFPLDMVLLFLQKLRRADLEMIFVGSES